MMAIASIEVMQLLMWLFKGGPDIGSGMNLEDYRAIFAYGLSGVGYSGICCVCGHIRKAVAHTFPVRSQEPTSFRTAATLSPA